MLQKSSSCDRCLKKDAHFMPHEEPRKVIKKPESYIVKKFDELYEEDRKWHEKRSKRIAENRKQKETLELTECTFKPKINNNEEYFISNDPFLEREANWKSSIEKKISSKREQEQQKQKNKFTFQPKISNFPKKIMNNSTYSKTNKNSSTYSASNRYTQRNSYKNIHSNRKKLQQLTKSTIIEPFQHRKQNSHSDLTLSQSINFQKNISMPENIQSPQRNPEQLEFRKKLTIKQVTEYEIKVDESMENIEKNMSMNNAIKIQQDEDKFGQEEQEQEQEKEEHIREEKEGIQFDQDGLMEKVQRNETCEDPEKQHEIL